MRGAAAAIALLALALAGTGCSSVPEELEGARSADAEDRVDAAIALATGYVEGDDDFVSHKAEIAAELRRLLDDRSALVRQVAVDALASVEGRAAAGAIADRLRDKDTWVRYVAAKRLGDLEARTAVEPLVEALRRDESADVRRAAAQALGKIRSRAALRELYLALQDEVPAVRYRSYLALRAITGVDRGEDPRAWRDEIPRGAGE